MGMKFATEISNIQRVGVISYMGMKLKYLSTRLKTIRSYPLYGNEIVIRLNPIIKLLSYPLYGNEILNQSSMSP